MNTLLPCPRTESFSRLPLSELTPEHLDHLEQCGACGAFVARGKQLAAQVRQSAELTWSQPAHERTRAALLTAARREASSNGDPLRRRPRRWWARVAAGVAMLCAASAAAAIGGRVLLRALRGPAVSTGVHAPLSAPAPSLTARDSNAAAHATVDPTGTTAGGAPGPGGVAPVGDGKPQAAVAKGSESAQDSAGAGTRADIESSRLRYSYAPADELGFHSPSRASGGAMPESAEVPGAEAPAPARPRVTARAETAPERGVGAAEHQFARGWEAARNGKQEQAARLFAGAARAAPGSPISEDALYWEAVTWARLGRPDSARRTMTEFLHAYPRSSRAHEVGVMLGWLLVRAGSGDEARPLFEAASSDPVAHVRQSAQAGLRALRTESPAPDSPH